MQELMMASEDGAIVQREDLYKIRQPEPMGPRHQPIPHWELIEEMERAVKVRGAQFSSLQLGLSHDGARMFGIAELSTCHGDEVMSTRMGFRSANDQAFSISIVVGMRIFVCSNLILSGDAITLRRKHTTRIDLQAEIGQGIAGYFEREQGFSRSLEHLRTVSLGNADARSIIMRGARAGVIAPSKCLEVEDVYQNPPHAEYGNASLWTLHNAFTHTLRDEPAHRLMDRTQRLGVLMGV